VTPRRIVLILSIAAFVAAAVASGPRDRARAATTSPIQHVVIIYQENHSFDNVLGLFCTLTGKCAGASEGTLSNGQTIQLKRGKDLVPQVDHRVDTQETAINNGQMNGFDLIPGCTEADGYACFISYDQTKIPNLWSLASTYAVSDATFENHILSSWGGHLELVAATLDGFTGDNPVKARGHELGLGWGCDSFRVAPWVDPDTGQVSNQPSCVPASDGSGPWRPSPVDYVPTIMDRLDGAGLSWKLYASQNPPGQPKSQAAPYGWAICPTFAECISGPQAANMVPTAQVLTDASAGTLPNFSVVLPNQSRSQHNNDSMLVGDNWIGQVVSAIQSGPDWASTAIFITYDDCGCFYDHVAPPPGYGIRVPMVIVSPYAIQGDDPNTASFASLLAFTEHTFGLDPLGTEDATAYDYANAFNYARGPRLAPFDAVVSPIPAASLRAMREHPADPDDPT